jgi:hypothetical protein
MTRAFSANCRSVGVDLGLAITTLFSLAAPAAAADQVPFSDSITGVFTVVTRPPGGVTESEHTFSGNATYLGSITGTGYPR